MDSESRAVSGSALLKLQTKRISRKKYLGHVVTLIKDWSGCACVGVRIKSEDGTIPYESYTGFSEEFWKSENWISTRETQCACTRVMTCNPDPLDEPYLTNFGTFLCNDAKSLIAGLPAKDKLCFRRTCVRTGYKTLAIIPIRYGSDVVAAIHLADERENLLPGDLITAIESVTPIIGEAIQRFGVEDKLRKNYAMQRAVNAIMRMSLEDAGMEEILGKALEKVLSMSWFAFEQKGCIFLVKEQPGILEMVVQKGVSKSLLQQCARVPFEKCYCGRAAAEKVSVFSAKACVDEDGHGHYCLPIISSGSVLGVLNFFLKEGQQFNPRHKEFLSTIANVLAGIIIRKQAEEKLRTSREQLRLLATHLQSSSENDRTEFAREVHDELGQALTALKMDMFWIRNRLPDGKKSLVIKADECLALIDSTIRSVRRICTELRPDVLDHLGIVAAVEWQIAEFRKRTGIGCVLKIRPRDIKINRDLSITVFRIIQEALTNIIRHAGATEMDFTMDCTDDCLSFRISDNGKGITKKVLHGPKSFGLMGISERVRAWNGTLRIEGAPGKGTTLSVTIPLVIAACKLDNGKPGNAQAGKRVYDEGDVWKK